jgi:hypothetical protein
VFAPALLERTPAQEYTAGATAAAGKQRLFEKWQSVLALQHFKN